MRRIDADALYEALDSKHEKNSFGYALDLDSTITRREILWFVKNFPSAEGAVGNLPSAQPERKKGEGIPVTNGRGGFECDQCHNYAPSYQDGVEWLSGFCPSCGADMRGEQDDKCRQV